MPQFYDPTTQLYPDLLRAYLDARKNERNKQASQEFELHLEDNLLKLKNDIINRTYEPSTLTCFVIDKPVIREIFAPAFRDRIVSHYVFNKLNHMFERTFIYDSYSCRKKKGTLFGIKRAYHHLKSCTNNFTKPVHVLSMDISGYFMSIDRDILNHIVVHTINKYIDKYRDTIDYDIIIYLINKLIYRSITKCNFRSSREELSRVPTNKSLFTSRPNCGLIIGDLMSQEFSNVYLNVFDQYIKHTLKCKHYGRYVDDSFIIHEDKKYLESIIPKIDTFLRKNLNISLNLKKTRIIPSHHNFIFLGSCIRYYRIYPKNKNIRSFKNSIHIHDIGSINAHLGIMIHLRSFKIRKRYVDKLLSCSDIKTDLKYSKVFY